MTPGANQRLSRLILIFTLLTLAIPLGGVSHAFCIYNKSDRSWYVDEVQGDSVRDPFAPKISPGNKKCCDWDDKDCNVSGERNAMLVFDVKSSFSSSGADVLCSGVTISADGAFSIMGSDGQYYCNIH